MIATSSPSLMMISFVPGVISSGRSTYSKFMVTKQLSSTLACIPVYFASSVSNSLESGRGAGRNSDSFDVCELADAKYRMVKLPAGGLVVDGAIGERA